MRSYWLAGCCGWLLLPCALRAQTAPGDVFGAEARFKQSVSVRAEGIPVRDLLARISAKTGVALRADGDVGDDKIIAFCPARPLADTLKDVAALFNDEWQPSPLPNGQMRWLLIRRLSARHYEDALEQSVSNRQRAQLDEQVRALDETPAQFAKRPADDRIRKNLENPSTHGRQATRLYAQLSREQRDILFVRGFVNVSFAASTPTQQAIAREGFAEVVTTLKGLDEKQRAEFPDVHIVIDSPEELEQHGARFRLTRTNNAGLSALVVQVILGQNTYMTMGDFESADEWLLPPHGNPYRRQIAGRQSAFVSAQAGGTGNVSGAGRVNVVADIATADLPTVETLRKVGKDGLWIDRLKTLADAAQVPVLSDYYRSLAIIHDLSPEAPAAETPTALLDAFCKRSGYLWWPTPGKTLLLRKRDWYAQRRYEAPDAWLRDIQTRLRRQKNVPTYGDVCRLLELTPMQIVGMNAMLENGNGNPEGLANLDTQEGLPELLTILQADSDSFAPLPTGELMAELLTPTGEPTAKGEAQSRLPMPTPQQAALIGAFLNVARQTATPANLRGFAIQAYCLPPTLLKAAQSPPPQNVQVILAWKLEGSAKSIPYFDRHRLLWLPAQIPDDRSDKTQIEVTSEAAKKESAAMP